MAYQAPYQPYGNPYQSYQYQPVQPQQPVYQSRPVTSREEALGQQVDFFSAGTLMPDLAHGVVYLKRFNQQTGASDLFEFRAVQSDAQEKPNPELDGIRSQIQRIEDELERLKTTRTAKVAKRNDDE